MPKKVKLNVPLVLSFSDADKQGTIQPHDYALVVTLRIGGYDVKRVMVDQGSADEIMYPDLYKGLGLKPKNLTTYSSPLVSFKGKMAFLKGRLDYQCKLVQMWLKWILLWWMFFLLTRPL